MGRIDKPQILFTVDFDAGSDEHPYLGWQWLVSEGFNSRDDFRAVVNFEGLALERHKRDKEAFAELKGLIEAGRIFIGNHSWDHPSFTGAYTSTRAMSRAEQADQLLKAHEFISKFLGEPAFFRAPFFDHDNNTLQLVAQLGIRYDLSNFVKQDEFRPVEPYEFFLPTNETLIRIDTNLKLSPLEWVEPIAQWSGELLEPGGLFNVITHPREFSEPEQGEEMRARLKRMLAADVEFIGPDEIEWRLGEGP